MWIWRQAARREARGRVGMRSGEQHRGSVPKNANATANLRCACFVDEVSGIGNAKPNDEVDALVAC